MLEQYFVKPETIDKIKNSWISLPIERYVSWLSEKGYSRSSIMRRVSRLLQFGEYAKARGAKSLDELPSQAQAFTDYWVAQHGKNCKSQAAIRGVANEVSNPIQQMLRIALPDFVGTCSKRTKRYKQECMLRFLDYLREERGLKPTTLRNYQHYLGRVDEYLDRVGVTELSQLSPVVISALITDASFSSGKEVLQGVCNVLRLLLRYLQREKIINRDLSSTVEQPQKYRLSEIPRLINWDQVRLMLERVDCRTPVGRRDYAILLLLVTYGLRAREIASLTLDDVDWKRERILVSERKAGHNTAYPLAPVVGNAIIDYIQHGRPQTTDRHLFFRSLAPQKPMDHTSVSQRATLYLKRAGISVPRPGSHTLRHTCVQKLLEANVPLKTIGDYVGHRSASSTRIYTKIDVEGLREVALGDGEEIV